MAKCCSCNRHIAIAIVGLSLSLFEMILALVYNFHFIGFGFSLMGIVTSSLYLHFMVKEQTARHRGRESMNGTS